jgi:hypothetical protein
VIGFVRDGDGLALGLVECAQFRFSGSRWFCLRQRGTRMPG